MTAALAYLVCAALFVGVVAYAIFAGADFGSGFYDLTAGDARRGAELRTLVDHSIGPVWEANHVWLIYVLVIWWTGFPGAFAAAMTTLIVPILLALLGIVLRGASFAFRKFAATLHQARLFGVVFASSSFITPFFLGASAGGIASGRVPAAGYGDVWTSWLNPTSVFGGLIAVGTCAFLAGAFLTADAERSGHHELSEELRVRALAVGVGTGVIVFGALVPLFRDADTLSHGLIGPASPLIVLSALAGGGTLLFLWRRQYAAARIGAVAAVVCVLAGWGVAQFPWLLVDQLKIVDAAGATATLWALLVVVALAGVLVLPALVYLFRLTQSESWSHDPHAEPVVPGPRVLPAPARPVVAQRPSGPDAVPLSVVVAAAVVLAGVARWLKRRS
ncbi:MAG TPA: cytochrome d ubiquinol oxidase subunit II [Nocardioides sp.]|nr:cytochrome d ubiquinol oxidase subunit II [Nocardioides sp.]